VAWFNFMAVWSRRVRHPAAARLALARAADGGGTAADF
jgi:hypothetical protein